MNRTKFLLPLLFIFFCGTQGFSQALSNNLDGNSTVDFKENTDVEGSSMLFDDWQNADLVDVNDNLIEDVLVNYDGLKNRFISKTSDDRYLELNIWNYKAVKTKDKNPNTYVNITSKGEPCYCKLIYEGENVSCYEKFTSEKKRSNGNKYASVTSMYKMSNKTETYIYHNKELKNAKRKAKFFDKMFKDLDLKNFVKSNDLDLKRDEDLAKLLEYIDNEIMR